MPQSPQQEKQDTWPLNVKPGIKRDGTTFEGEFWTDGEWTRFQRGLPRSIGGYQQVTEGFGGPSRALHAYANTNLTKVHSGYSDGIQGAWLDQSGFSGGPFDRTPASGFTTSAYNNWQLDVMRNAAGSNAALIAHAATNLNDISDDTAFPVWYGNVDDQTLLVDTGAPNVSGGMVVLHPYLMVFGSGGYVAWSDANSPTVWAGGDSGSAYVTEGKIVRGIISRGGFYSPAGLLWGLTSLVRVTFVGGSAIFRFDTVSDQTSILSSNSVIEYDGLYFWPGVDRFLVFNGTVKEVPNTMNLNYFYDNLNFAHRQKVWACKVPRYGEIWWFYPHGDATECNNAIIYNVRENCWYDAGMSPGSKRSSGYYAQVFPEPLMMSNIVDDDGDYSLYKHEVGANAVDDVSNPIVSSITTCDFTWPAGGPNHQWTGIDRQMRIDSFEPDFVMQQSMLLEIFGRDFAQGPMELVPQGSFTFGPSTEKIDMHGMMVRQMRLKFTSNIANNAWQMGQPLFHFDMGDRRRN